MFKHWIDGILKTKTHWKIQPLSINRLSERPTVFMFPDNWHDNSLHIFKQLHDAWKVKLKTTEKYVT